MSLFILTLLVLALLFRLWPSLRFFTLPYSLTPIFFSPLPVRFIWVIALNS